MKVENIVGKTVAISFKKAIVRLCDKIDIKYGFIQSNDDIISIEHMISCTKTEYGFRLIYNSVAIMTGVVTNVDEKFLSLSIYDNENNFKYDKIIAMKTICGIKVYNDTKKNG